MKVILLKDIKNVGKKDEIINEIESRRIDYYKRHGLPVPPLEYGNQIVSHLSNSDDENDGAIPADQLNNKSGCLGILVTLVVSIGSLLYSFM